MARRLRKPIRVWIPAAAAVIIILVASTIYIGLFRERRPEVPDMAMMEGAKKDTVLIAMATPVVKAEAKDKVEAEDELAIEIIDLEMLADEVIVQAMPVRAEAMKAAGTGKSETRKKANVAEERTEAIPAEVIADHPPLPVGGIEELNRWIKRSISYPPGITPKERKLVTVAFIVRSDGTVVDLQAVQTPGEIFTEEAFRLLREGPRWEPAIRNGMVAEEMVKVRITFK
jgi:hypothetical protein